MTSGQQSGVGPLTKGIGTTLALREHVESIHTKITPYRRLPSYSPPHTHARTHAPLLLLCRGSGPNASSKCNYRRRKTPTACKRVPHGRRPAMSAANALRRQVRPNLPCHAVALHKAADRRVNPAKAAKTRCSCGRSVTGRPLRPEIFGQKAATTGTEAPVGTQAGFRHASQTRPRPTHRDGEEREEKGKRVA